MIYNWGSCRQDNPKLQQPLRILNVNFQSIKTKQHLLENMIRSTYPDIIFGTETWIDNGIKDSQIFLRGYTIFRNDRNLQLSLEMYFFILAALSKLFPSWLMLSSFDVLGL
jgi:hypothetical protein